MLYCCSCFLLEHLAVDVVEAIDVVRLAEHVFDSRLDLWVGEVALAPVVELDVAALGEHVWWDRLSAEEPDTADWEDLFLLQDAHDSEAVLPMWLHTLEETTDLVHDHEVDGVLVVVLVVAEPQGVALGIESSKLLSACALWDGTSLPEPLARDVSEVVGRGARVETLPGVHDHLGWRELVKRVLWLLLLWWGGGLWLLLLWLVLLLLLLLLWLLLLHELDRGLAELE
mmetsp:Transcript_12278/g.23124  ORF Transcript_12278/g.23124 Transcript_12278/m.23124 type:complete len:228 (-) Transcript_12278:721-1404(-)